MAAAIHEERRLIRHPTLWRDAALNQSVSTTGAAPLDVAAVPHEVLLHVASYLDKVQDLLSFGAVCKTTQTVSADEALWKRYAAARDAFNRRRGTHFSELDRERAGAKAAKERLCWPWTPARTSSPSRSGR